MNKFVLLHIFSAPQSVYFFMEKQLQFMIDNGAEVHVVIPSDTYYKDLLLKRELNVKFHFIPIKRKISLINDLFCLYQITKLIKVIKPNILHLHTPKASFIGALAGKLALQKNIIYQMHGLVSAKGDEASKGLMYVIEKMTCTLVDEIFCVSKSLMKFAIEKKYCSQKKIKVIKNGTINGIDSEGKFNIKNIDITSYPNVRNRVKGKFVIGFIGRINEDKGIEDFLKVVKKLSDKIPMLVLILGKNEIGNTFKKLIEENKIDTSSFIIIDEVNDPENIMSVLDVLLLPTKREGFGLVAAEVNSLAIPVVAYDIPGVRDAISNNKTGILNPFMDIEALELAVYEYYLDSEKRNLHGFQGRQRVVKMYNQKELWQELLKEYEERLKD